MVINVIPKQIFLDADAPKVEQIEVTINIDLDKKATFEGYKKLIKREAVEGNEQVTELKGDSFSLVMEGEDYDKWGLDDTYPKKWLLGKLGLQEAV